MSGESSPRAQLVELLWQLKQNYDQSGDGSLRFIHFNTLLNDSQYRAEVIEKALSSEHPRIRELGRKLKAANRQGGLLHKTSAPATAGGDTAPTPARPAPRNDATPQRSSNFWWLGLGTLALVAVIAAGVFLQPHLSGLLSGRQVVAGPLTGEHRWSADRTWVLDGIVYVEDGARLTIEPGTRVEGQPGSALVITRGASLHAASRLRVDAGSHGFKQSLAPLARQRCAAGQPQRAQAAMACQAERGFEQARVGRVQARALQPQARYFQMLRQAAPVERLSCGWQAERAHVPADQLGIFCQGGAHGVVRQAARVGNGLQRQPFQSCPSVQRQRHLLRGGRTVGSVEARGARRRDQAVRPGAGSHVHIEQITADQSPGRVNDHVVADRGPFRVEALEDAQRSVVLEVSGGFLVLGPQVEREAGMPGHGRKCKRCEKLVLLQYS